MEKGLIETVWNKLKAAIIEVLPECDEQSITLHNSLKALGANSIDRAEIIILTLRRLNLKIPLIEFAQAQNLKDLVTIFSRVLDEVDG